MYDVTKFLPQRRLSVPYSMPSKVSGPVVVRRNPGRKARDSLTPAHCPPGEYFICFLGVSLKAADIPSSHLA